MRITISEEDSILLCSGIQMGLSSFPNELTKIFGEDGVLVLKKMYDEVYRVRSLPLSQNKVKAIARANRVRVERVKEKIIEAVEILKKAQKPVTAYSVSKQAGVSYNTVKKYEYFLED